MDYIEAAKRRKARRMNRSRIAHKIKKALWRVYGAVCLAGLGLVGLVGIWEAGKIIEWTFKFIKGLIELI